MRKIVLAVALLIATFLPARGDERKLASLNALTAVAPSGFQCAASVAIVVRAPNEAAFEGDRRDLQRLLGGVRASLGFECPKLETLIVQGEAAGRSVYRGVVSKDTSWVLVGVQGVEDKQLFADAKVQTMPGNALASPLPSVAQLPEPADRGPSFPCAAAQTLVERLICGNERLSALDRQMDQAFRNANGSASPTIRNAQNAWRRQRDLCRTPDCVANLYQSRTAELTTAAVSNKEPVSTFASKPTIPIATPAPPTQPTAPAPPLNAAMQSLPDRMIWQGTYRCGPMAGNANLVIMGSLAEPKTAYLVITQDEAVRDAITIYPFIVQYNVHYDDVLNQLNLSGQRRVRVESVLDVPRQLDVALDQEKSVLRGNFSPSCAFTLKRKLFPAHFVEFFRKLDTDISATPPMTLAAAESTTDFCLVLSAWAKQVRAGASGRDVDLPLPVNDASRLFLASIFHVSLTQIYLGRDIAKMNRMNVADSNMASAWWEKTKSCMTHPIFFQDSAVFNNVFYYVFTNIDNLHDWLNKLPEIQLQIDRILQAGDKFTEDSAGLMRLGNYTVPIEEELKPVLPRVREAMLRPLKQQQDMIALKVLQEKVAEGEVQSLEQITYLDGLLKTVRSQAANSKDASLSVTHAEAIIEASLRSLLGNERPPAENMPETLESYFGYTAWRGNLKRKFERFVSSGPYKEADAIMATREAALRAAVAEKIERDLLAADSPNEFTKFANLLTQPKRGQSMEEFRPAYDRALETWMQRAVTTAASAPPPSTSAASSAPPPPKPNPLGDMAPKRPTSSDLDEMLSNNFSDPKIVKALFKRDFALLANADAIWVSRYLVGLIGALNNSCPGVVPSELISKVRSGSNIEPKRNPDGTLNFKDSAIGDVFKGKDLNDIMRRAENYDNSINAGDHDGEIVVRETHCQKPALKQFIDNTLEYLRDPTSGRATTSLSMTGLCQRWASTMPSIQDGRFCSCAGPIVNQRATPLQKQFAALNDAQNFGLVIRLSPTVENALNVCRQ